MLKTLVFCEISGGKLKRSSEELLQFACRSGFSTMAIVLGSQAAGLGEQIGRSGVKEFLFSNDKSLDDYNPEYYFAALKTAIDTFSPDLVLGSASSVGRDLFPKLTANFNGGLASDCVEITATNADVQVKKPLYSGKCFADVKFDDCKIKFVLMRANQLPVESLGNSVASGKELQLTKPNLKSLIKEVVRGASQKLDLTEANIIVSGGRGLKDASNFKLLQDLAEVLGATVGASRAVVDSGWVPHEMQVGQTGKTVAPSLYIAVGISGAIQHLAGMSSSKVIVAINSDSNAPIFQKATYGIVGDLFQIIPLLTEEFKKVLNSK